MKRLNRKHTCGQAGDRTPAPVAPLLPPTRRASLPRRPRPWSVESAPAAIGLAFAAPFRSPRRSRRALPCAESSRRAPTANWALACLSNVCSDRAFGRWASFSSSHCWRSPQSPPRAPRPRTRSRRKEAEPRKHAYHELLDANQAVGEAISELEAIELRARPARSTPSCASTAPSTDFDLNVQKSFVSNVQAVVVEAYTNSGSGIVTAAFGAASIQDLITSQALIDNAANHVIWRRSICSLRSTERTIGSSSRWRRSEASGRDPRGRAGRRWSRCSPKPGRRADAIFRAGQRPVQGRLRQISGRAAPAGGAGGRTTHRAAVQGPAHRPRRPGWSCPVAGSTWFIDTWGAPRSGGRTHKGVDMSAAYGTKLVAMNSGTGPPQLAFVRRSPGLSSPQTTGTSTTTPTCRDYAPGLSTGQIRVNKGQVIGYVGTTGNATTAHLHLGLGLILGGPLVNPYPTVRRVC